MMFRPSYKGLSPYMLLPVMWTLLLCNPLVVDAQKRGDIVVHFMNDSDSYVEVVWVNKLVMQSNGEMVPVVTGPIPPKSVQSYKAYLRDAIELREDCSGSVEDDDFVFNQECRRSAVRTVQPTAMANVFILSPNFDVTVSTNEEVLRAMFAKENIDAKMRIINQSDRDLYLYWNNPNDQSLVSMSDTAIAAGKSRRATVAYFSATVFHQFWLLPEAKAEACGRDCPRRSFRVTETALDVVISSSLELHVKSTEEEGKKKAADNNNGEFHYQPGIDLYEQCRDQILSTNAQDSPLVIIERIRSCIKNNFDKVEWEHPVKMQTYMDYKMEDYICDEPRMETSPAISTHEWTNNEAEKNLSRTVRVLHERPSSSIHLISDFVSQEECQAMEEVAEPLFQGTKAADRKGVLRPNIVRKASIAPVEIPREQECSTCPITRTRRRVFEYTKRALPQLNITEAGQELFMAVHYRGRGREHPNPDQYKAHLDFSATGPLRTGARIATMVMYCGVADEGGHTHFRTAHVHIKPERGMAAFFTYADPVELVMDKGVTMHTGCPVYHGVKKIVTQWIRYGVDKDKPHSNYPA